MVTNIESRPTFVDKIYVCCTLIILKHAARNVRVHICISLLHRVERERRGKRVRWYNFKLDTSQRPTWKCSTRSTIRDPPRQFLMGIGQIVIIACKVLYHPGACVLSPFTISSSNDQRVNRTEPWGRSRHANSLIMIIIMANVRLPPMHCIWQYTFK